MNKQQIDIDLMVDFESDSEQIFLVIYIFNKLLQNLPDEFEQKLTKFCYDIVFVHEN